MRRLTHILIIAALVLGVSARAQEVVIDRFPIGVGGSADRSLFEPYLPQLRQIAAAMTADPLAMAVVTGGADGERYGANTDALNPGLALGRAMALRRILIDELAVDSTRITLRLENVDAIGPQFRYASVRLSYLLSDLDARIDSAMTRLAAVEGREPVIQQITQIVDSGTTFVDNFTLRLGGGLTTSPLGGMPVAFGGLLWKRTVGLEAVVGHTLWNSEYQYDGENLDTKERMAGALISFYPFKRLPVAALGGWLRYEEMSLKYYEYVRMSEGPMIGLRAHPLEFLAVTALWNPAKHRAAGIALSDTKNGQLVVSLTAFIDLGGSR